MKKERPNWIQQAESDIRQGNGVNVIKKLRILQKNGVPKDLVFEVAILAKRVGLYQFATNLLFREVIQKETEQPPEHMAEYASCLSRVGNYLEANEIFSQLPDNIIKDYAIQYADCLFHCWDYNKACQVLVQFQPPQYETYKELVYALNLTSAQTQNGQLDAAENLITMVSEVAKSSDFSMILANSLEILGQVQFQRGKLNEAQSLFQQSEKLLRNTKNVSWLYSLKWCAILELQLNPGGSKVLKNLQEVRGQARKFMHWETLRDCDLYQAIHTQDSSLLSRVYFGTPNPIFREKVKKENINNLVLNPNILMGPKSDSEPCVLDLNKAQFQPSSVDIEWNDSSRKLIIGLTKDLYRPASIYQLNREIFSEEHFNPFSSRDKTYKVVRKLRDLLENHPTGARIENRRGYGYRFRAKESLLVIYPDRIEQQSYSAEQSLAQRVFDFFGETEFNRKEFCHAMDVADRSGSRMLKDLVDQNLIEKIGSGPATKYKRSS